MTAWAVPGGQPQAAAARGGATVTRFAPSPTGRLHLGHAWSAVKAHDLARAAGGRFLLRIEDIDAGRSRPAHVHGIVADLRWLGLRWDGYAVQSARLALYAEALARLEALGVLYPCFCTRGEIAAAMGAPHPGEEAVYPGTCRGLEAPDLSRSHAWRLDVGRALGLLPGRAGGAVGGGRTTTGDASAARSPDHLADGRPPRAGQELWWHDAAAGWVRADPLSLGDVVLARKDAPTSYHLAVTVDDAAQGVTDVVRGADLFAATHVHRLLQALLGLPTPRYHHHPLLLGPDGERLAKRHGSPTLAAMRERGDDGPQLADRLRRGDVGFAAPND